MPVEGWVIIGAAAICCLVFYIAFKSGQKSALKK